MAQEGEEFEFEIDLAEVESSFDPSAEEDKKVDPVKEIVPEKDASPAAVGSEATKTKKKGGLGGGRSWPMSVSSFGRNKRGGIGEPQATTAASEAAPGAEVAPEADYPIVIKDTIDSSDGFSRSTKSLHGYNADSGRSRRRRYIKIASVLLLLALIAGGVVAAVLLIPSSGKSGESFVRQIGNRGAGSQVQQSNYRTVYELLVSISGEVAIADKSSPQHDAADWIMEIDGMEMTLEGSEASTELDVGERYVLSVLYYALDGPSWSEFNAATSVGEEGGGAMGQSPWTSDDATCTWEGVQCNAEGRVTSILLSGRGLKGGIPSEISYLRSVTKLDLFRNELSSLPGSIGGLPKITYLDASSNQLKGSLPSSIYSLDKLQFLYLSDNAITGTLPNLSKWKGMVDLRLENNSLRGNLPNSIGEMKSIRLLMLHNNQFTGPLPSSLGNCKHLWFLHVTDNDLSGPIPDGVFDATSLKRLYLSNNAMGGDGVGGGTSDLFYKLVNLETLWLEGNQFQGQISTQLGSLLNLASIRLQNNSFVGQVPEEVCTLKDIGALHEIDVDCAGDPPEVICTCCENC